METILNRKIYVQLYFTLLLSLFGAGCRKFIEIPPPVTSTTSNNVYTNDATAIAALTGIYTKISSASFITGGLTSLSLLPALSADELTLYNTGNSTYLQYYRNSLNSSNILSSDFWYNIYPYVYACNAAIEGLNFSEGITPGIRSQLLGEAKFIRAFCFFYLVNLYGDIPLPLTTDYTVNMKLPRTDKNVVYKQIISDLNDAEKLLGDSYLDGTLLKASADRVRPTRWAAVALLARVYLFTKNYMDAETKATVVINNSMFGLPQPASAFLNTSSEAIWQLQPVIVGQNTQDAILFILPAAGPNTSNYPVYLNQLVVNAFESNDQRKDNWTKNVTVTVAGVSTIYYYPAKYKIFTAGDPVKEYNIVLRLSEQYLIRAEARLQEGKIPEAKLDLNKIRSRAGLGGITANSRDSVFAAIQHERQVELFTEWGHRWLDLKRSGTIDSVMNIVTPLKGGVWNLGSKLYPIPISEMLKDQYINQNPGY